MDGVAISIIGRPRPLPGHDTPNPAHNTYTLKCEEPLMLLGMVVSCRLTCSVWNCVAIIAGLEVVCPRVRIARWVGCSPSVVCR